MQRITYGQLMAVSWRMMTGEVNAYACPLCFTQFPLAEIDSLTWDHYPPQSIGGQDADTALVCQACAYQWSPIDKELDTLRKAQEHGAAYPNTRRQKVRFLNIPGLQGMVRRIAVEHSFTPERGLEIRVNDMPEANRPEATEYLNNQLNKPKDGSEKPGIRIHMELGPAFHQQTVNLAFLKAAYLTAFNCLGYKYILSPALAAVRQLMHTPDVHAPLLPVLAFPQPDDKKHTITIHYLYEPKPLRSIAVFFEGYALYRWYCVLLPLPAWSEPLDYEYLEEVQEQRVEPNFVFATLDRKDPSYLTGSDLGFEDAAGTFHSIYNADLLPALGEASIPEQQTGESDSDSPSR